VLNLNDLQIFVQVVDHGGFAAASRALGLPKQTLSKRVAELERKVGVRLIQRTSRSFAPTEIGREVHRHAAAMVVEAEAVEAVIRGRLAEPSGTVRITASVPVVQMFLAPLLPTIAVAYPQIRIVLVATDRYVDIVQEGYDIALRSHAGPLPDSGLVRRHLSTEPYWLLASPGYCARYIRGSAPGDIESLSGLFSAHGEDSWTLRDRDLRTTTVRLEPRYVADEATALLAAAKAGLGIARLPAQFCAEGLSSGVLQRVLPGWTAGEIETTLLVPHRRGLLPSVRVVADLVAQHLRDRKPAA